MKILFYTDGSELAENAVKFGARIAAACEAETTIVGIAEGTGREESVQQALQCLQDILKEHRLDAELITRSGRPVPEIIKCTRESSYDLVVVVGAEGKGRRGPFWMSARPYKIIRLVDPPVLVVVGQPTALKRILLCAGSSPWSERAMQFAGEIAQRLDAAVTVLHVMPAPPAMYADLIRREQDIERILDSESALGQSLRHLKEALEKLGVPCTMRLRLGFVVPEVLKELRQTEYDLVMTGSVPATDPLRRYLMGNVTREIVDRADIPLLVLRTQPKGMTSRLSDFLARLFKRG